MKFKYLKMINANRWNLISKDLYKYTAKSNSNHPIRYRKKNPPICYIFTPNIGNTIRYINPDTTQTKWNDR